jgi:hypothetical protein
MGLRKGVLLEAVLHVVMLNKEIVKSCMTLSVNHIALVGQLEKLVNVICLPAALNVRFRKERDHSGIMNGSLCSCSLRK